MIPCDKGTQLNNMYTVFLYVVSIAQAGVLGDIGSGS